MKIKVNVKGLVDKHKDQIAAWRGDITKASWARILVEICRKEGIEPADYPTIQGFTAAWKRLHKSVAAEH